MYRIETRSASPYLLAASVVMLLSVGAGSSRAALIGHWKLDSGSGTTAVDETASHDGQLESRGDGGTGPTWVGDTAPVPSGSSSALAFDGSDDLVSVPDADELSLLNTDGEEGTISLWTYADRQPPSLSPLFVKRQEHGLFLDSGESGGVKPVFALYGANSGDAGADGEFALSEWHHLAVSWTAGSGGTIYLDGEVVNTYSTPETSDNQDQTLTMGYNGNTGGNAKFFDGRLDEVRLYDEALSGSEVQNLVPEPSSLLIVGLGGVMLWSQRRRRTTYVSKA